MKFTWVEAVRMAVLRSCARHGRKDFYRQEIIAEDLDQIVKDTGSAGKTPDQTLTATLEKLRDMGEVEFVNNRGHYRLLVYLILPE